MPRTNNCLLKFESSEINIIADKKFFTIPLFGISDNQFAHKLITGENGYWFFLQADLVPSLVNEIIVQLENLKKII